MKFYVIIFFSILLISCDITDSKFKVVNSSEKTISVYLTIDSLGVDAKGYFYDLFFVDPDGVKRSRSYDFIFAGDTSGFPILGQWDSKENFDNNGNLYLFVIDSVDIGQYVKPEDLNTKVRRYQTSLDQMRDNGWVIEVK